MKKATLILFLFIVLGINALAQKEIANWCFGNGESVNISANSFSLNKSTPMASLEGCASISDNVSGRLLFYTDGVNVWDSTYSLMPSGKGLNGDVSSTQSALIVPMPCNPSKYYIFTIYAQAGLLSGSHAGLNYSIVDMTLHGGLGDVATKNVQMFNPATEKLCATFAADNASVWVMAHRFNSAEFVAYNVSSSGISKIVSTVIGSTHQDPIYAPSSGIGAIGAMQFSTDGRYLALANAYSNSLEVFQFDKSTGHVIRNITTDTLFMPKDGPYGLCFSQDNSKLYATTIRGDALYQYDMAAPFVNLSRKMVAWDTLDVLGQLQLALDGKIYIARLDRTNLGVIDFPNKIQKYCGFVRKGPHIGKAKSMLGLPNFISNYAAAPVTQKVYYRNCDKLDSLSYTILPIHTKGKYNWNFDDPASGKSDSSSKAQPTHNFGAAGYHHINMNLTGCNYTDTFNRLLLISPHPFTLTINSTHFTFTDKTISVCPGTPVSFISTGAATGFTYQWYINHTKYCSCDSALFIAYKSEMAVVQSGVNTPCFTSDTVYVNVYSKPTAEAIQNAGACIHYTTKLWAKGGAHYQWLPNKDLDSANTATPTFSGEAPMTYTVIVTDTNNCKDTTTASVDVYNTVFANAGSDLLTDEMGSVQLHGNSNGLFFTWTPAIGMDNNHILTPTVIVDETTKYTLIAIDSHGCKAMDSVWVHVNRTPSLFVTGAFTPNGDGINDEFKVFTHNITHVHLRIYNRLGNVIYESTEMPAKWDGRYNGMLQPEGTYYYDIEANTYQGTTMVKHGDVALIH